MIKWYVVKVNTNNGVRIGMIQQGVQDPMDEDIILERDLTDEDAEMKVKFHSKKLGIPAFDNNVDIEV